MTKTSFSRWDSTALGSIVRRSLPPNLALRCLKLRLAWSSPDSPFPCTLVRLIGALKVTRNSSGLQPALDHIIAHMDDAVPEPGEADGEGDDEMEGIPATAQVGLGPYF